MSSYLELLNLTREPFSNSPDPDAYYRTPTHEDCLNRLEIAIRLRRGTWFSARWARGRARCAAVC